MRVIDKRTGASVTVSVNRDYSPVRIVGDDYLVDMVMDYLHSAYGYGGHILEPDDTTMLDVVTALSDQSDWELKDVPSIKPPQLPHGSVS